MLDKNLVYRGKSKDVYKITSGPYKGKYRFVFSDRGTGYVENGKIIFDPGYDNVVGNISGKGKVACKFATYFFKLLKKKKIPSHYINTINENTMIVEPATLFSMPPKTPEYKGSAPLQNLEFTFRNNTLGSFWRRYPFLKPCQDIDKVVEVWTKGKSDIQISFEALEVARIMNKREITSVKKLVRKIATVVSREFASKGLHLVDGKVELGRLKKGGKIVLIDEVSPDVLRVCKGYLPSKNGDCAIYKECVETTVINGEKRIRAKKLLNANELNKIFLNE